MERNGTSRTKDGKTKWNRKDSASVLLDFESEKNRLSQRQFAEQNGVARTTLQHWIGRKTGIDACPQIVEFFESPAGTVFLQILLVAIHFEFCKNGPASIRNVCRFLKLSGLDKFVASSFGAQRGIANDMDRLIISFGETKKRELATDMPEKWITLCEDETFHPSICMVAIEAMSNFILVEEYAESRDGETWNGIVKTSLEGLPVKVVQVSSDEASGLKNHTEKGLGASHSPDVFHVQQEIARGTSGPLAGAIKKAEKKVEAAEAEVRKAVCEKNQYDGAATRPKGRRPDFEKRICLAEENENKAISGLDEARRNQETVRQARRDIGDRYHPYDPESGERQDAEQISRILESSFDRIKGAAAGVRESGIKRIGKAHRVVKGMVANVAFFFALISQYMDNMELSGEERGAMETFLVPGFYLLEAARKEKDKVRAERIVAKAKTLLSIPYEGDGPLSELDDEARAIVERAAKECAGFFQRSSSCVEGRNAQLSLRHHGIHRLSTNRLKALTVVHNFHVRRRDGTTAAQRFFETEHENLFDWLVQEMDCPPRPRKRLAMAA